MSNKKEIKRAVEVAAALDAAKVQKKQIKADQKSSKKVSKNQEKAAKKSQEYERGEQFQEGQFGGSGAVARARQRHFASSGNRVVRHPAFDPGVKEDVDGVIS